MCVKRYRIAFRFEVQEGFLPWAFFAFSSLSVFSICRMFSPSEENSSAHPAKEHSTHVSTIPRVVCLSSYMKCLRYLFTKIRDRNTSRMDFVKYSDRLMSVLCEEGLSYAVDAQGGGVHDVITPTDSIYKGVSPGNLKCVSIEQYKCILESFVCECCPPLIYPF